MKYLTRLMLYCDTHDYNVMLCYDKGEWFIDVERSGSNVYNRNIAYISKQPTLEIACETILKELTNA